MTKTLNQSTWKVITEEGRVLIFKVLMHTRTDVKIWYPKKYRGVSIGQRYELRSFLKRQYDTQPTIIDNRVNAMAKIIGTWK